MSNFVKQINGFFTISVDGIERPNLVVNTGLSNIFKDSSIASLCQTLKVYNDDTEVAAGDTDYLSPVASSSNIIDTIYGVSGTGTSDYFYMKRTWTFSRGQISGVINKLAVFSDDGTLYAAALLKNAKGELDPVRPLFAPRVEITYESRWHFKQGDSFTVGTPVYFSDAGMVTVKTNMASKNNALTYGGMDKPFTVTTVELFSDVITTDDIEPTMSLGVVDALDYTIEYVDGVLDTYGQKLNIVLPKDKYISDTPIATIMVTTTRGKWQIGFDAPLEKPSLSKREIIVNLPFIHGTLSATGEIVPGGNPSAIDSIFSALLNSTYSVSTRQLTYDGVGLVSVDVPGYFATLKNTATSFTFSMPDKGTVTLAFGDSSDVETYLDDVVEGVLLKVNIATGLKGAVDGVEVPVSDIEFGMTDVVTVTVLAGQVTISNDTQGLTYTTDVATSFTALPAYTHVGMTAVEVGSSLTIY